MNPFSSSEPMLTTLTPPQDFVLEPLVRAALMEDLGRAGDITSLAIVPERTTWQARLVARQAGIIAGLDLARLAFTFMDPTIRIDRLVTDGTWVEADQTLAIIEGQARALLAAERVALNYLCRLSGIATATHQLVQAVKPWPVRILCTRKTTPMLRVVEKYAVRAGGGANHRFGLDDAILIKDNHIAVAGDVGLAIDKARAAIGPMVKLGVEIDTLDQLDVALTRAVDSILLDNMDPPTLTQAVARIRSSTQGHSITIEASGRVNHNTAPAIAATGVDVISVGWITHSAPILDIALDS